MGSPYEIPVYGTQTDALLGWLLEAKQEAAAWLASQPASRNWNEAMRKMCEPAGDGPAEESNLQYPKVKRLSRELVASLAGFQHAGEFKVQWDESLYDTAHLLTQLDRNWERTTYMHETIRQCMQYGVNLGTGYLEEVWDPVFWTPTMGDVRLNALAPGDVTFVQLPKSNDIQEAYVVIIRKEIPINLAKRLWWGKNPSFAASLVPDRETASTSWIQKGLERVQQFISPALQVAGRTGGSKDTAYPTVDIFTAYTLDGSINEGYEAVRMGAYGTNWSYLVPAIGDPLPQGLVNRATGEEFTLPAKREHCGLFPLRRMTIFSATGVAFDGSSPWWHGEVPVARVWFNDLPWTALGGSITGDVMSMETGIVALMRGIEDSAAARLDPPAIVDDQMGSSWGKAFNPRRAGVRAQAPLSSVPEPIKYPFPPNHYDVPQWIVGEGGFIRQQEDRMDYLTGVRDLVAIAKAKQIPGSDTLEKLLEMAGPLVQDMVGSLVKPLTQLGEWRKAYYMQFYTEARIITTVGPDDGAEQISSTEFISDKLREQLKKKSFQFKADMLAPSKEKAKRLISEFRYEVSESGLNEIHRMTTKLLYIQLMKIGFPISPWTLAQILRIPNFGPPPSGTNTEMERWVAWRRMQMEIDIELAAEAQQSGIGPGGAPAGGGKPEGRPPSFNAPPRLETKDQGTRSTIATS